MDAHDNTLTRADIARQIEETLAIVEGDISLEQVGERELYTMFMPKMAADQLSALQKVLLNAGRDLVYWEIHPRPEENSIRFNVYATVQADGS